ncbi:MAG: SDR family NAD(P)-dependent oxidoreductase [Chitinophagaceae bacterium]|nr:MAG: SDR family NAD(P)-dependent oxidoreductase [Chitinophagaceae bacterium]
MSKVWFITGCSTGFGRHLAEETLAKGEKVAVTARNTDDVKDLVEKYPDNAYAIKLDVTRPEQVKDAVDKAVQKLGSIDVLVNNAGIGYFGAIEESEEEEVRRMFEINFFGLASVTNAVLPHLRKQKSGHIINISSVGGSVAFPGVGMYNATKFAVTGYSEALAKELAPLGIKVTVIAPSGFRTDWAGRSANDSKVKIDDYQTTAHSNQETIRGYSGNQPGDPVRAAQAIIKIVETPDAPVRLFLGAGALKGIRNKIAEMTKDIDAWEETTVWADHPKQ